MPPCKGTPELKEQKYLKKSSVAQEKDFLIYFSGEHLNPIFSKLFLPACEAVSTGDLRAGGKQRIMPPQSPRPGINTAAHLCSFIKKSEPAILKFGFLSDDQI